MMMMMVMMMMMFIMLTTLGLRAKIVMASMFMMEWICEDFGREMEKRENLQYLWTRADSECFGNI